MSPPGIDFDVAMQPSDIEDTPPPVMRRAAPHQDVDSLPEKQVQSPNDGINSGRLKSIIVTPTDGRSEEQEEAREVVEIADDEETLLQFQSKKKKRSSNSIILRSPRLYPSILRGASSKKRKLSQIQHSPGNGKKRVDGETSKGSKTLAITKHGSGKLITYKKEVLPEQNGMHQSSRQQSPDRYYRVYNSKATGEGRADTFHERVDRHGNIFGARVATKQTRVPPPPKVLENIRDDHHSWKGKGLEAETETQIQSYNSPPYTKRRDLGKERNMFKKAPFPQRGLSEWRVKPTEAAPSSERRVSPGPTLLYLSCPDPTEAAARRQRVLAGDAMGQTQERVASLLRLQGNSSGQRRDTTQNLQIPSTPSKEQINRTSTLTISLGTWNKSKSPPGIDFDVAMQPSDIEDTPPPVMRRAAPHQDVDSLPGKKVQSPNDGINSGRLKSIIVTPTDGRSEEQEEAREVVEIADGEETLL
ncbi:hypothetical protein F2Q69_00045445 [Brassica cretica]|uniref:Uncharacterized protein n=1 Tax=Brassica cretica TaxID=69181 RepID=A0A8S9NER1_BRACR|nr:hypothetical protein F2Q69_00045445 [Brassica cretica]